MKQAIEEELEQAQKDDGGDITDYLDLTFLYGQTTIKNEEDV